jgi:hypothetical protein
MLPDVFSCPDCRASLKNSANLAPGSNVQCPKCGCQFLIPDVDAGQGPLPSPPPEAEETFSGRQSAAAPRVRSDDEEDYADSPLAPRSRREWDWQDDERYEGSENWRRPRGLSGLSGDYTINFGEWVQHAKDHYSAVVGPMIGYMVLYFLIGAVLGVVPCGGVVRFFIDPPLQAGFTIVCLAQLKGKQWSFGDFFSGFQWYGALLANQLLMGLMTLALMLPGIIFFIATLDSRDENAHVIAGIVIGVNALLALCLLLRFIFNTALIIDRRCGPIEAFQGSWTITRGHFLGLLGVVLLLGLINLLGLLLCLVGVLFTIPLTYLALNAGYLLIAGTRKPVGTEPPDGDSWAGREP